MRLATIRVPGGTRAVRLAGGQAVETGHNDAGELLAHQGKSFEATTPVVPALVTPDELPGGVRPALPITAAVDGETVQPPRHLVAGMTLTTEIEGIGRLENAVRAS
jgi:2-keto-4-pentenoate hydratase/2-oxohepta-3-ene-1,7-dioic acid hydratase in catechol pathway